MLLRIEDTDQNRFVPGAEKYIFESLAWCGIQLDESPLHGGPHAPYRQSERKPMYLAYAQQLINDGHAYYAFDTAEELEAMRERLKAAKVASPQYNAITRHTMRNALTLPEDEVKQILDSGAPYVIRLKVPRKEEIRVKDLIRGWVVVHSSSIDDKVLMKSDGMPTYHLANIIDDHLMGITHVIRGEEWLPSAPLHVLLYRYLGWESTMPEFAHLPLLLKPDGNGKLSKRDGDKLGFPVFPLEWTDPFTGEKSSGYRESGYLPEAFINFLAFLGWNPGTQQELFSMDELVEAFSIDRIGKSGTQFDINKARWYNEQYLRTKPDAELAKYLLQDLAGKNIPCSEDKAVQIVRVMKERVTFPQEFWLEAPFFFQAPTQYSEKVAEKKWTQAAVAVFEDFKNQLPALQEFTADNIKQLLLNTLEQHHMKIGQVMQALRLALTGLEAGPDLMVIIQIIGPAETAQRIETATTRLQAFLVS